MCSKCVVNVLGHLPVRMCFLCQGKALSEQEAAIERGDTAASAKASARVLLLNQQLDQVLFIHIYMYICM